MIRTNCSKRFVAMLVPLALLGLTACGEPVEEEETPSDTTTSPPAATGGGGTKTPPAASVVATAETSVTVGGTLSAGALADATHGVMQFTLRGGRQSGEPKKLVVDADGHFTGSVARGHDLADQLEAHMAVAAAARDNRAVATILVETEGKPVAMIDRYVQQIESGITEADYQTEMAKRVTELRTLGTMTMFVAYKPSATGDKTAEAASFRFIGMPTAAAGNLIAFDSQTLLGNVELGKIVAGTDDVVQTEQTAEKSFSLAAGAIDGLARSSGALKGLKNVYMNGTLELDASFNWMQRDADMAAVLAAEVGPETLAYNGVSLELGSKSGVDMPFDFDGICGPAQKLLSLVPSAVVTVGSVDNSKAEISNADATVYPSGGGTSSCGSYGFYANKYLDDDAKPFYSLTFGTFVGDLPAGVWKVNYDGVEIARYDVASMAPLDASGHARVYMPTIAFAVSSDQKLTGATVGWNIWNGTEYASVTDTTALKKIVSNVEINASNRTGTYAYAELEAIDGDAAHLSGTLDESIAVSALQRVSVSYMIGDATYRFEISAPYTTP